MRQRFHIMYHNQQNLEQNHIVRVLIVGTVWRGKYSGGFNTFRCNTMSGTGTHILHSIESSRQDSDSEVEADSDSDSSVFLSHRGHLRLLLALLIRVLLLLLLGLLLGLELEPRVPEGLGKVILDWKEGKFKSVWLKVKNSICEG